MEQHENVRDSLLNCPKIIVASHERSGTHFLMDALQQAFGYQAEKWIDFTPERQKVNFFFNQSILGFFAQVQNVSNPPIVKTHHSFDFFDEVIDAIHEDFRILYVYREPKAVMKSFRRFLLHLRWREGPRIATDRDFIRAQPCGQMLRYQMYQQPSMIARWATHVTGWLEASHSRERIVPIAYEQLNNEYERTMLDLAERLGLHVTSTARPSPSFSSTFSVPHDHPTYDGGGFDEQDDAFIRQQAGRALDYFA